MAAVSIAFIAILADATGLIVFAIGMRITNISIIGAGIVNDFAVVAIALEAVIAGASMTHFIFVPLAGGVYVAVGIHITG